ncbi:RusA family crossover junction endodeoxyribonuclease [Novosphingobium umbonatum]|nr:RusA family crossover junction endodeoxyribonuclease [Novosphingobium umbonatum]
MKPQPAQPKVATTLTGTMTSKHEITFFLPFAPIPSPRPQARVIGKFASFYMPKAYMDWKRAVADYVYQQVQHTPSELLEAPVEVTAEYIVTPPKTTKLSFPKPDLDNYEKSLLDALSMATTIWKDDTQVHQMLSSKRWAAEGEETGMSVRLIFGR